MDMYLNSKRPKYKKFFKSLFWWIVEIALVILAAWLIIEYAVEKTTMMGVSMNTTLNDGDKIIINKLAYLRSDPQRYDVIVFSQNKSGHGYYNMKRVIGLPGETVEIVNGEVYINGNKMDEVIPVEKMRVAGLADDAILLGENEFFVLGDNRNYSEDSRFANIGTVVKNDIIGKAWMRLEPFSIIDKINRED
ncbi:MAG: signal peptidase I [Lachnospiraceae bacterium]|nr:signal peptidase I [Lachnospiraceae bacterium]MBQ8632300.1 signal peptidase I [Lachnospiraceae bacterium]